MNYLQKRAVSLVLVICLMFSLSTPVLAVESSNLTDVNNNVMISTNVNTVENGQIQERNAATVAVKKAIRWALSHKIW